MAYSPRYVERQEIPVQIPDDYTDDRKNEALELAEASIELDLNDGERIPAEDIVPLIKSAIKQKATCELVKGADNPDSTKLGDISDQGTSKSDYAQIFCDRYDELVGKIMSSDLVIGEEGGTQSAYVYSTRKPE